MSKFIAIALAGAAMVASTGVSAQQGETRTEGVRYTDLDLSTQEGRDMLDQRIERAARNVCGMEETTVGSRLPSRESRRCYNDAKSQLDRHFAQIVSDNRRGG